MLGVGYVGSNALKQFHTYNWNERGDKWLVAGSGEYDRIPNPFYRIFPALLRPGGVKMRRGSSHTTRQGPEIRRARRKTADETRTGENATASGFLFE